MGEPAWSAAWRIPTEGRRRDHAKGSQVRRVLRDQRVAGRRGGTPSARDGQVLVRVKAVGINPSEAVIRTGAVAELFPSAFPSGQGTTWRITTIR
jgi:NADPH:quinone reductase-like Zn-dependent oxidoreductase